MSATSSASAACSPWRPAAVRSADAPSRRAAALRAHRLATWCTTAGDAAGLGVDLLDPRVVRSRSRVQGGDGTDRVPVDRPDRAALLGRGQARGNGHEGRRSLEPMGHDEQVPPAGDLQGAIDRDLGRLGPGRIEIVDHLEHRGVSRGIQVRRPAPCPHACWPVNDVSAPAMGEDRQLRAEPRLSDAGPPGHHDRPPVARGCPPPVPAEPAQIRVAADQRDDRVQLRRQRRKPGRGRGFADRRRRG